MELSGPVNLTNWATTKRAQEGFRTVVVAPPPNLELPNKEGVLVRELPTVHLLPIEKPSKK